MRQEHERAFHAMAGRRELPAGENYMVDAETALVTRATVWLHGAVWFFDHYDQEHPEHRRVYMYAARQPATLWRPRT